MTVSFSSHVDLFLSELALRNVNTSLPEVQLVVESLRNGSLANTFASAAAENAYIAGKSIVFYAGLLPDGSTAFQAAQEFVGANRELFYVAGETPMNQAFTNAIDGQFGFKNSFLFEQLPLEVANRVADALRGSADTILSEHAGAQAHLGNGKAFGIFGNTDPANKFNTAEAPRLSSTLELNGKVVGSAPTAQVIADSQSSGRDFARAIQAAGSDSAALKASPTEMIKVGELVRTGTLPENIANAFVKAVANGDLSAFEAEHVSVAANLANNSPSNAVFNFFNSRWGTGLKVLGTAALVYDIGHSSAQAADALRANRVDVATDIIARLSARVYFGFEGAKIGAGLALSVSWETGPGAIAATLLGGLGGGLVGAIGGEAAVGQLMAAGRNAIDLITGNTTFRLHGVQTEGLFTQPGSEQVYNEFIAAGYTDDDATRLTSKLTNLWKESGKPTGSVYDYALQLQSDVNEVKVIQDQPYQPPYADNGTLYVTRTNGTTTEVYDGDGRLQGSSSYGSDSTQRFDSYDSSDSFGWGNQSITYARGGIVTSTSLDDGGWVTTVTSNTGNYDMNGDGVVNAADADIITGAAGTDAVIDGEGSDFLAGGSGGDQLNNNGSPGLSALY